MQFKRYIAIVFSAMLSGCVSGSDIGQSTSRVEPSSFGVADAKFVEFAAASGINPFSGEIECATRDREYRPRLGILGYTIESGGDTNPNFLRKNYKNLNFNNNIGELLSYYETQGGDYVKRQQFLDEACLKNIDSFVDYSVDFADPIGAGRTRSALLTRAQALAFSSEMRVLSETLDSVDPIIGTFYDLAEQRTLAVANRSMSVAHATVSRPQLSGRINVPKGSRQLSKSATMTENRQNKTVDKDSPANSSNPTTVEISDSVANLQSDGKSYFDTKSPETQKRIDLILQARESGQY